jgi:parallel beta-helix repeat protein
LREGVTLRAMHPGAVTLASADAQPAILARRIDSGAAEGLWIVGDENAPLIAGIEIDDASPLIANCKITGANTGIEVRGVSSPMITSNQIVNNTGAGIEITGPASPKLSGNMIAANGAGKPGPPKPGVEVREPAHPVLKDNAIVNNASDPIWIHGHGWQPADYEENFFGVVTAKNAIRRVDAPPAATQEKARKKPQEKRP